jgi:hypothetical protein
MRMKFKKLLASVLLLSLWGGGMIFADTVINKIKVTFNGSALNDSAIVVDGTTYVPLRQVANQFGAFVTWGDNKQVNINKPNVHLRIIDVKSKSPFQAVPKSSKEITFIVTAEVDNLSTPISSIKIVVLDPSGAEQQIYQEDVQLDNAFYLATPEINYKLKQEGEYKLSMYMKPEKSSEWTLVSEKMIIK